MNSTSCLGPSDPRVTWPMLAARPAPSTAPRSPPTDRARAIRSVAIAVLLFVAGVALMIVPPHAIGNAIPG